MLLLLGGVNDDLGRDRSVVVAGRIGTAVTEGTDAVVVVVEGAPELLYPPVSLRTVTEVVVVVGLNDEVLVEGTCG